MSPDFTIDKIAYKNAANYIDLMPENINIGASDKGNVFMKLNEKVLIFDSHNYVAFADMKKNVCSYVRCSDHMEIVRLIAEEFHLK